MDRIASTTKSGVFVEAMCRLDVFENNRIALYKGFQTANRVTIYYDFTTNLISITAILPIDSVDTSKPVGSKDYISFPPSVPSVLVSAETTISQEIGENGALITTVTYVAIYGLLSEDEARTEPRKNIQITLDVPNLKAIIDATIPFRHYLNNSGAIETIPLDE
jgi:hypothetical protein